MTLRDGHTDMTEHITFSAKQAVSNDLIFRNAPIALSDLSLSNLTNHLFCYKTYLIISRQYEPECHHVPR